MPWECQKKGEADRGVAPFGQAALSPTPDWEQPIPCSTNLPEKKLGPPPKCWGLGLPQEGCPWSWDPAERCCLKAAPGHVGAATRGMRAGSPSVQTSAFWGKQPPADADSFCAKFHTSLPKHS